MEAKLVQLKTDFNNIINIRTNVKNIFDILQSRINKLKGLHAEFIKASKTQMFIFGLDSFHFQSKLIDMEYDEMKRLFLAISNRMYCEYFKLYKIITEYIISNKNEKTLSNVKINSYPIYKDLEPYKEYEFETIQDIHENILNLVGVLISTLNNKENEFLLHKNKQSIGLNIDNFITSFNYSINIMKEKIIMFTTYIQFFHKLHTKYLKRFSNKIQLMYSHISHDIHFDDIKKSNSSDSSDNNSKKSDEENDSTSDLKMDSDYESNISTHSFETKGDGVRSRTNSSTSSNTQPISPKFKLKNIMNQNENDDSLTHNDVNDMFSNIDMTCNSIINKNKKEKSVFKHETEEKEEISENNINIYLLEPPIDP
jgi:hypothetical protein